MARERERERESNGACVALDVVEVACAPCRTINSDGVEVPDRDRRPHVAGSFSDWHIGRNQIRGNSLISDHVLFPLRSRNS